MNSVLRQTTLAVAALVSMAAAPMAQATVFSITDTAFVPDGGYGKHHCQKRNTLLDVRFDTSGFSAQTFSLDRVGASRTFDFGTVDLKEPDAWGCIDVGGIRNLDVLAALTFSDPVGMSSTVKVFGHGAPHIGPASDPDVGYVLTWKPTLVHFGDRGLFEIRLSNLFFYETGPFKTETATITLKRGEVPEPGTVALFGLALAGIGLTRRRRAP